MRAGTRQREIDMWQHEIFPDHSIKMFGSLEGQLNCSEQWRQALQGVKHSLKQSQFFFFGDSIEQDLEKQRTRIHDTYKDSRNMPVLKFPYNAMCFEYTVKTSTGDGLDCHKSTKRIIHLLDIDSVQLFFVFAYFDDGVKDLCKPSWFILPYCAKINKITGYIGVDSPFESMDDVLENLEISDFMIYNLLKEVKMSLGLIDILNCQNVITKDVLPPEKLNRKRIRNGKLPLYSYKILEVVKGKPRSKNAGSVPWDYKSPANVRFHLCRGHFKTFTQDKPLFGKYSGTFWWNPQSRGNKELGEVEKDYEVKVV